MIDAFPHGRWHEPAPDLTPAAAATDPARTERTDARGEEDCRHSWFRQEPMTPATYRCTHCGKVMLP